MPTTELKRVRAMYTQLTKARLLPTTELKRVRALSAPPNTRAEMQQLQQTEACHASVAAVALEHSLHHPHALVEWYVHMSYIETDRQTGRQTVNILYAYTLSA